MAVTLFVFAGLLALCTGLYGPALVLACVALVCMWPAEAKF
jgi:hypothetical protein